MITWAVPMLRATPAEFSPAAVGFLGRVCERLAAQRGVAFRYEEEAGFAEAELEWRQAGVSSLIGGRYLESEVRAAFAALRAGEVLPLQQDPDAADFPGLRETLRAQGSLSVILLPIRSEGKLLKILAFEYRERVVEPPPADVELARAARDALQAGFERLRELKDLEEAERRIRDLQKLETLGTMAGGVAHDFNNVLQAVLGLSELLKREELTEEAQTLASEISTCVTRAADLTHRLLVFSRQEVRQRRRIDVVQEIEAALALLRRAIREDCPVRFESEVPEAYVYMSPVDFQQAIVNLCNNAADAMPQGGTITLRCRLLKDAGDQVEVTIEDEGEGMTSERLARATELFFTTKPPGRGTGLGLSLVKRSVEGAGGRLRIESEPGRGTRVEVSLPVYHGEQEGEDPAPLLVAGDETVLLVEDDPFVRRVAASQLGRFGYQVLAARDGAEALEIYRGAAGQVDLIVTDVVMPKLGGVALYAEIEKSGKAPPTIFTTGYDAGELTTDFFADPQRSLIQKPYSSASLLRQVRRLLDG